MLFWDPGSQIRYPGWVKIRIRDKHPGSATLSACVIRINNFMTSLLRWPGSRSWDAWRHRRSDPWSRGRASRQPRPAQTAWSRSSWHIRWWIKSRNDKSQVLRKRNHNLITDLQGTGSAINYGSGTRTLIKWNHESSHRHSIKLFIWFTR